MIHLHNLIAKRRLQPIRKLGAQIKQARITKHVDTGDMPAVSVVTEETNPEQRTTYEVIVNTPEYVPPSAFSSLEESEEEETTPSITSHAAIEIKTARIYWCIDPCYCFDFYRCVGGD